MTDEEIKKNWAEMSKDFQLDVHVSIGGSFNNAMNFKSMTLRGQLLNFKIMQNNSLLVLSGAYGTYTFRDIHDFFSARSPYFLVDDYELFADLLVSKDVNCCSAGIEFVDEDHDAFKYSCEAIKLAVKKYKEIMKIELSPDQNILTIGSVVYEAKPNRGGCTDCYFGPNTKMNCKHPSNGAWPDSQRQKKYCLG